MQKRIVISNGKKYIVNTPGWEGGAGAGSSIGTLWMSEGSASWFAIVVTGSKNTAQVAVSQSRLPYTDNSLGYQLLAGDDGRSYFVYLSGNTPTVTLNASQSAYTGSASPKPNLLIQSSTDNNFYKIYLHNAAGTIQVIVDPLYVSASWIYQSGIY